MEEEVFAASDLSVGDVILYPAILRPEHKNSRGYPLRVSRIEGRTVHGFQIEGEQQETEFALAPLQLEENGVLVVEKATA